MRLTLRSRITGGTVLIAAVSLAAVSLVLPGLFRSYWYAQLEESLADQTALARLYLEPGLERSATMEAVEPLARNVANRIHARITVIAPDGKVLADTESDPRRMENHSNRPEVRAAFSLGLGKSIRYSHTLRMDRIYVAMPVTSRHGTLAVVRLSLPLDAVNARIGGVIDMLLAVIGLAGVLGLLLNLQVVHSLVRPIRLMSRTAQRLAEGDLGQRVRIRSTDELGDLARAFNHMAKNLERRMGELREIEGTMRAAFAHMADGVVVLDAAGRIVLFNSVSEETFGMSARQALGRTLLEVALHPTLDALVLDTLRNRAQGTSEIELRRPSVRTLRVYITSLPGEEESALGALLVFQDLTEIRRLENVRRDFMTNVSHELKTPLATMGVMVDTLKGGKVEDRATAERFLATLGAEVMRMGRLVDELMDLSRIESGHLPIEPEVISLNKIVVQVAETFRPAAEKSGQTLTVVADSDSLVWADPNAIVRIASNLVENAMKYTPDRGSIEIGCGCTERELFLRVADSGIGIPESERSRIFERFYRVDKARSRSTGGTGLGLSIAKHLAELHGGRIEVESVLGRGSSFTVWLPSGIEDDGQP